MQTTIIHGTIVSAPAFGKLDITENGYLIAENGRITGVYPDLPEAYSGAETEEYGDCLIVQAPADLHLHAPQYPMMGAGMDRELLQWLEAYTFPTEAKFADADFARELYRRFAAELVQKGTTRVCVFSSRHRTGTRILVEELEKAGVCGYAGKVSMDRNCSVETEAPEEAKTEVLRWLEECGDFTKVKPILTPRFTPACSDGLMDFLGNLSAERDLPVQSHLSESLAEQAWVRELCPESGQYWETYAKRGLWHNRTIMAHCVWSDERERAAMAEADVTAVHCPASNLNLCSGVAPVRKLVSDGVRVALGSDIAGGDKLSMFDVAGDAVRSSKYRTVTEGTPPLTPSEAWFLAVSAGAEFFGDAPGFAAGNPLHAVALCDTELPCPRPLTPKERLERCLFVRQRDAVKAVWSGGRKLSLS